MTKFKRINWLMVQAFMIALVKMVAIIFIIILFFKYPKISVVLVIIYIIGLCVYGVIYETKETYKKLLKKKRKEV
jgi:ABC-type polysaccharide/polyol phosphate export permease